MKKNGECTTILRSCVKVLIIKTFLKALQIYEKKINRGPFPRKGKGS